ncbi:hypothetical protein ACOMCU_26235 [Lysinibacillus sp. UGB7]|uniref:hypothetical protein n=1 Tax=Lysinibacillus sp. UGB7 TaxID=3411039 RepID=UPI003B77F4EC
MFEIKKIDFTLYCEKIDVALEQKVVFSIEDNKGEREFGNVYKGVLLYDWITNNTSKLVFNNFANKITLKNKKDTHFFYFSISCNENNINLEISKFDCVLLSEEKICSINFDKERYKEFQNINSRSYIYNLDGRHILLQVLDDIILVDSVEKVFYNTGNKYDVLFNSYIDTFINGEIDYIYVQNGKYNWKDKKQHFLMSETNHEFFKKTLKEDDSIYILPITELIHNIKLKLDVTFTRISTCNHKCGYPYFGGDLTNGILSFQINDFVNNQTTLVYYSILESKIIKRKQFNTLYDIVYAMDDDFLTIVDQKQNDRTKEIISITENKTVISIPAEEHVITLNKDYILTAKYDEQNGDVNLFVYKNQFTKKKIGEGKQYFIDFDKKIIVVFK